MPYRIIFRNGPIMKFSGPLGAAKKYAERYTPMKAGWTREWSTHRVSGGMGVSHPHTHYLLTVKNSNGRTVNVVNLTTHNAR